MLGVRCHATLDYTDEHLGVRPVLGEGLEVSVDNLLGNSKGIARREGLSEGEELVDDAAKRPDIGFL